MTLPDNVLREPSWRDLDLHGVFGARVAFLKELGLKKLGANTGYATPGKRTCPLHSHVFEEEVFLVLEGVLTVRELEEGAEAYREFELHAGELIVYPPNTGLAHGFYNRGEVPAKMIGLSTQRTDEICTYPDSGKTMLRALGQVGYFGDKEEAPTREVVTLGEEARPDHVVTIGHLAERDLGGAFGIQASRAGGATQVMVNRDRLPPGAKTSPLHWHTHDEELVFVLRGTPTLRQLRGGEGAPVPDWESGTEERVGLQVGDVVAFGPHRPVAHQLLNESDEDVVLLVVGTNDPADVCVLPETGRVYVRGLDRADVLRPTGYFEGEV